MADYGTLQAHATPMLALLYADGSLTTYPAQAGGPSTVPPGTTAPYVSVHFVATRPDGGRLQHRSTRFVVRAYAHCVGEDDIAARAVADRVAAAWLDVVPTIAGRSVYPIRHEQDRETTTTEPVVLSTVEITSVYRLESEPGVETS